MFDELVEQRIASAQARGDFDNLEGGGRAIDLAQDVMVPGEWRLAFRVLKNAGYEPAEVTLRREIAELERKLSDDVADVHACRRFASLRIHLSLSLGARDIPHGVQRDYHGLLVERLESAVR